MNRAITALILLCFSAGVFAAEKDAAFKIDKRLFKKNYRVVALAPVDAEPYLQMPDSAKAMIEQEITTRLQKKGYTVIPSSVLAGIRKTMEEQVGGIRNQETGRVNVDRQRAVREHAFRELWFREKFDALVLMRVSITSVPMESDRVEWDGARAKLQYEGRSKKYSANVAVSSVALGFYDSTMKPIYMYYGGLEPLMYRAGEQLQPLTADKFFLDEERIRKAAQIAVSPI